MFFSYSYYADKRHVQENPMDSEYSLRAVDSWYIAMCFPARWKIHFRSVYNAGDPSDMLLLVYIFIRAFWKENTQKLLQMPAAMIEWYDCY